MPPENRTADGRFIPGVSPNPGGRPKEFKEFERWIEEECYPLAKIALKSCLQSSNEKVQLAAVREVFDRYFGKPRQTITGADGGPIRLDGDIRGRLAEILAGKG